MDVCYNMPYYSTEENADECTTIFYKTFANLPQTYKPYALFGNKKKQVAQAVLAYIKFHVS